MLPPFVPWGLYMNILLFLFFVCLFELMQLNRLTWWVSLSEACICTCIHVSWFWSSSSYYSVIIMVSQEREGERRTERMFVCVSEDIYYINYESCTLYTFVYVLYFEHWLLCRKGTGSTVILIVSSADDISLFSFL